MTKLKKVLSKIYYYTWRILLIIILCCLSVYSIANTVNYFVDRNKQVQTNYREIQNIINPSINPQGLSMSCPITNYLSYRPNQDQSHNFTKVLLTDNVNYCYYNYCGNVLTLKDFTSNDNALGLSVISFDHIIPNEDYIFIVKLLGNYEYDIYCQIYSNRNDYFDNDITTSYGYSYLSSLSYSSDSIDFYIEFGGYDYFQFEFYMFLVEDINSYFNISLNYNNFNSYSNLILLNLCIPYGSEYFEGGGNNSFYDSEYVLNYNTERYYTGYDTGYSDGSLSGYNEGYVDGKQDGDSIGYDRGYYDGSHDDTSEAFQHGYNAGLTAQFNKGGFLGLANLIFNAPYNILHEVFNFEFLGVNLWGLMSFVFTTALIFAVIKLFV